MARPRVRIYNQVSIDGRVTGFDIDGARYYQRAFRWRRDAILMGSQTALAFGPAETDSELAGPGPAVDPVPVFPGFEDLVTEPRPLLAVVDSGGIVRNWRHARAQPWYAALVALVSSRTPRAHLDYLERRDVQVVEAGDERVDLAAGLELLAERYDVASVVTDAGGGLNGALIDADLVDDVAMILAPVVAGRPDARPFVEPPRGRRGSAARLVLREVERLDDGALWLEYEVSR